MATFHPNDEPYLKIDRVGNLKYPELVTCPECHGILWLPKACNNCDAAFCSSCLKNWQLKSSNPTPCPKCCSVLVERRCPAAVLHILNSLDITCRNKSYGCSKTLSYNSLETHEEECGYRQLTCRGCQQEIAKKDFKDHDNTCPLVLLTCGECNSIYQRKHQEEHTETKCLREQLIQQKAKMNQLENRINNLTDIFKQLGLENRLNNINENFQQLSTQSPNISEEND